MFDLFSYKLGIVQGQGGSSDSGPKIQEFLIKNNTTDPITVYHYTYNNGRGGINQNSIEASQNMVITTIECSFLLILSPIDISLSGETINHQNSISFTVTEEELFGYFVTIGEYEDTSTIDVNGANDR